MLLHPECPESDRVKAIYDGDEKLTDMDKRQYVAAIDVPNGWAVLVTFIPAIGRVEYTFRKSDKFRVEYLTDEEMKELA